MTTGSIGDTEVGGRRRRYGHRRRVTRRGFDRHWCSDRGCRCPFWWLPGAGWRAFDGGHRGPAGRRQPRDVRLEALQRRLAAWRHARAIRGEVGAAGLPDRVGLGVRWLSWRGYFRRHWLPRRSGHFRRRSWRRDGRCRRFRDRDRRRRRARRCSRHDRAYRGPAGRRQPAHVLLETIQRFLPTRLHARAVRHEILAAGLADSVRLSRRRLLRLYLSNCQTEKQAATQCCRSAPHDLHQSHPCPPSLGPRFATANAVTRLPRIVNIAALFGGRA